MNCSKYSLAVIAACLLSVTGRGAESKPALVWDSERKVYDAKTGELEAHFFFEATNASSEEIVITEVHPSCGCTVVSVPAKPWKLAPGESGKIEARLDLIGKRGILTKRIEVTSSVGVANLVVQINVPSPPEDTADLKSSPKELSKRIMRLRRVRNRQMAAGDRQAVFRNGCVECHVQPSVGKTGKALFDTSCGICHEAENRATMVPKLADIPNKDYWHHWITQGKEGSLMPAFSKAAGGPLTDEQIDSLVNYLATRGPSPAVPSAGLPTAQGEVLRKAENALGR